MQEAKNNSAFFEAVAVYLWEYRTCANIEKQLPRLVEQVYNKNYIKTYRAIYCPMNTNRCS